jgi:hypothetical protein
VLERISEVSLGVMSVALIFGLTHIRQGVKRLEPEMHLQARRILDVANGIVANPNAQTQVTLIRQWVRQTDALQRSLLMLAEEEAVYAKQGLGISVALISISIFHSWRGEKRLNQIMQYAIETINQNRYRNLGRVVDKAVNVVVLTIECCQLSSKIKTDPGEDRAQVINRLFGEHVTAVFGHAVMNTQCKCLS